MLSNNTNIPPKKHISELSIIMAVYNAEKYVFEAISSLLSQTYMDFELIIIDDGSTDKSLDIVRSIIDSRLVVCRNSANKGVVFTRNRGLQMAQGKFIAMFDADDIASPNKFELQIAFLKNNPTYSVIGCSAKLIDSQGCTIGKGMKLNASHNAIPTIMFFRNYFINSAIVYDKEKVGNLRYTTGFDICEDYEFITRIMLTSRVGNMSEKLVSYRIHSESAMNNEKLNIAEYEIRFYEWLFILYGIKTDNTNIKTHISLKKNVPAETISEAKKIAKWLIFLLILNNKKHFFRKNYFRREILRFWIKTCWRLPESILTRLVIFFAHLKLLITNTVSVSADSDENH